MVKPTKQFSVTPLVLALIASGYASEIVGAPFQPTESYEFGLDTKTDAKLMPGMMRTAYTAVAAACLRENAVAVPTFDSSDEDDEYDGGQPEKPLTYAEAQAYAAAVFRVAQSWGKHDESRWLLGMTKRTLVKDENGLDQVSISVEHVIVPFDVWLTKEIERTDPKTSTNWYMFVVQAKQLGAHVPLWEDGYDAAKDTFNQWLDEAPWSRDNSTLTRKERAVGRSADRKWELLKSKLLLKDEAGIAKVLDDWTLLMYSPKMAENVAAIKSSPQYKLHLMQQAQEAQLAQLEKAELNLQFVQMQQRLAETQKAIDERMAALNAAMGIKPPEAPKAETAKKPAKKTKKAVRKVAKVTSLPKPAIINSR